MRQWACRLSNPCEAWDWRFGWFGSGMYSRVKIVRVESGSNQKHRLRGGVEVVFMWLLLIRVGAFFLKSHCLATNF